MNRTYLYGKLMIRQIVLCAKLKIHINISSSNAISCLFFWKSIYKILEKIGFSKDIKLKYLVFGYNTR